MYDKDGSGSIELPEMIEIIGTLYEMEGVPKVNIYFKNFFLNIFFPSFFYTIVLPGLSSSWCAWMEIFVKSIYYMKKLSWNFDFIIFFEKM